MAVNLDNSITYLQHQIHSFIDWLNHWDNPRTPREEKAFYDLQGKINLNEVELKTLIHRLRVALEYFREDYPKEISNKEHIRKGFTEKATHVLKAIEQTRESMNKEQAELCQELEQNLKKTLNLTRPQK